MAPQENSESSLLERIAAQCEVIPPATESPLETSEKPLWSLPGFGSGARVMTSFGHVPVEALRRRDPVKTRDGRFLRVQYVDTVRLDRRFLLTHPEAQPVVVPQNGLGANVPKQTTLLSGAQGIRCAERYNRVYIRRAEDFIGQASVARKRHGYFTYFLFHCGEPCCVSVNGMWVELDPGNMEPTQD